MADTSLINSFFKFLEKKEERQIPFLYKLKHYPKPLKGEDLFIKDSLRLYGGVDDIDLTELPDGLTVYGSLAIVGYKSLTKLPNNLTVHGNFHVRFTSISEIKENITVHGTFFIPENIKTLSKNLHCRTISVGSGGQSELTAVEKGIKVSDTLRITNAPGFKELPDGFNIEGSLVIKDSGLKKLPKNLTLNGPDGLNHFHLGNSPLLDSYENLEDLEDALRENGGEFYFLIKST